MKRQSRALGFLLLMSIQALGQETGDRTDTAVADAESRYLFINMLEFLGEFETGDGEWISPDILDDEAFSDLDSRETINGRQDSDGSNRSNSNAERD